MEQAGIVDPAKKVEGVARTGYSDYRIGETKFVHRDEAKISLTLTERVGQVISINFKALIFPETVFLNIHKSDNRTRRGFSRAAASRTLPRRRTIFNT